MKISELKQKLDYLADNNKITLMESTLIYKAILVCDEYEKCCELLDIDYEEIDF